MLANMGFDVWVGNNRGTRYSKKGSDRPGYWNFSFDELAKYDVPALVDNILNLTGRKKLIYVGHSQGSTQLVARLTEDLNFAAKIALNVGLGTVVTLHTYSDDCILRLFEKVPILQLLKWLGFKTMLSIPAWLVRCVAILTYNTEFYPTAGLYVIHFVCGFPKKGQSNIKRDRLGVIFSHEPGGSSINNVIQWYHLFSFRLHTSFEKQLGKFDHGRQQNLKLYGREKPPRYQLENLKDCRFPTLLFRGTIDSVVSETDFEGLAAKFPAELTRSVHIEDYHHLDYVWADSAHSLVYPEILKAAV
jgi:lysosomal acid lipase/cholesteryl ester hydrolase